MTTPLKPPPVVRAVAPKYSVASTRANKPLKTVLYWGDPFTGKTTYAKSFPNPLFLYFDPNFTTLESHPTDIPCVHVTSKAIMDAVATDTRNKKWTEVVRAMGGPFANYTVETVVVDSFTFLDKLVDEWLDDNEGAGRNRWGVKNRLLHSFFNDVCHGVKYEEGKEQYYVVTTAHEKIKRDDKGNVCDITMSGTGDFGKTLVQYMDTIIFCTLEVPVGAEGKALNLPAKHICRTAPPDKWRKAGARGLTKLPPILEHGAFYSELQKFWGSETKEK